MPWHCCNSHLKCHGVARKRANLRHESSYTCSVGNAAETFLPSSMCGSDFGGESHEKRLIFAFVISMSAYVPTVSHAQQLIGSYVALLSEADHFNSKGQRLTSAAAIIRQDRANFHRYGIKDPQDEGDTFFADEGFLSMPSPFSTVSHEIIFRSQHSKVGIVLVCTRSASYQSDTSSHPI